MARLGSGTTTDTTSTSNELYYAGEAFRLAYDVGAGTGSRREQTDFENYVISATAIAVEVTGDDLNTAAPLGVCTIDSVTSTTTKANCSGTWVQNSAVNLIPEGLLDISTRNGQCRTTVVTTTTDSDGNTINVNTFVDQENENLAQERLCTPNTPIGNCVGGTNAGTSVTEDACESPSGVGDTAGEWFEYNWLPNTAKQEGKFYIYIPKTILSDVGFTESPQPGSPLHIAYSIDYTEDDPNSDGDAETRVIETDIIGFRWTPMFTI